MDRSACWRPAAARLDHTQCTLEGSTLVLTSQIARTGPASQTRGASVTTCEVSQRERAVTPGSTRSVATHACEIHLHRGPYRSSAQRTGQGEGQNCEFSARLGVSTGHPWRHTHQARERHSPGFQHLHHRTFAVDKGVIIAMRLWGTTASATDRGGIRHVRPMQGQKDTSVRYQDKYMVQQTARHEAKERRPVHAGGG